MKKTKRNTILMIVLLCITFTLTACQNKDFKSVRSFEYYFTKEEYEEKYNKVEKTIKLEQGYNYKINIVSSVESGTISMKLSYTDENGEVKLIDMDSPITETVEISSRTTSAITFKVQIDPDTQGNVKVEIFRQP